MDGIAKDRSLLRPLTFRCTFPGSDAPHELPNVDQPQSEAVLSQRTARCWRIVASLDRKRLGADIPHPEPECRGSAKARLNPQDRRTMRRDARCASCALARSMYRKIKNQFQDSGLRKGTPTKTELSGRPFERIRDEGRYD